VASRKQLIKFSDLHQDIASSSSATSFGSSTGADSAGTPSFLCPTFSPSIPDVAPQAHFSSTSPLLLLALICGGGWVPSAAIDRLVDVIPRKLLLFADPRGVEQVAFASSGTIMETSNHSDGGSSLNKPGIRLRCCAGASAYMSVDATVAHRRVVLPQGLREPVATTDIVTVQDPFAVLQMSDLSSIVDDFQLRSGAELVDLLKSVVISPKSGPQGGAGVKAGNNGGVSSGKRGSSDAPLPGPRASSSSKFLSTDCLDEKNEDRGQSGAASAVAGGSAGIGSNPGQCALMQEMTFLRYLLVQIVNIQKSASLSQNFGGTADGARQLKFLERMLSKVLGKLVSIAALDPVLVVMAAFRTTSLKGVQLEVLKNLLKEGDVPFLEQISHRLWEQYKHAELPNIFCNTEEVQGLIHLTSLSGDIVMSETKIRAATHFPTIKLAGVGLERMTGRWYYEVTLLSDGLMQIGWANALFHCDPVYGQGVGDHMHSWAFDGLRCKKWNVSCDSYGRRWHMGDTVGVLADMDLQEIKFYLNGEDLGQAYENFSPHELFPAISLNVRQSVRMLYS
jgi:hypothetical protein